MMNLREMKNDELKDIARGYSIGGAWKMTKDQLIENILKSAALNGDADKYYDGNAIEAEAEVEVAHEEAQIEPESTEEAEVENDEPENEEENEAPKEVKKPSLKIKELTFNGKTQTIKEWAAELEMPWPTLYDRVNRNGWSTEEALTIPLGGRRSR